MDIHKYKIEERELPSYLFDLLSEKENVTLIHLKSGPIKSTNGDEEMFILEDTHITDDLKEELDLTGNPLDVDLHEESTTNFSILTSQPDNWTIEENKHFPMDINEARKLLNILNLNKVKDESNDKTEDKTYFCICNGKDQNNVIALGSVPNKFKSINVRYKGYFKREQNEMQIVYMIKEHLKNIGMKSKINNTLCTHTYSIVGYNMKKCENLDASSILRSAIMRVSMDKPYYSVINEIVTNADLMLQVLPAHKDAVLHSYWEQLELIQFYIDLLSSEFIDTLEISTDPRDVDYADVTRLITQSNNTHRKPILKNEKTDESLNYDELRDESFLDKLWSILIHCERSSNVKDILEFVFEEVANNTLITLKFSESSKMSFEDILNGILNGATAVPTLTTVHAIELLIELGIEKLKNDYLYIIQHYDKVRYTEILAKWSTIAEQANPLITKNKVTHNPRITVANRKTRVTFDSKQADALKIKLNYITNLHVVCELLYLTHSCSLPSQHLPYYTLAIFNEFTSLNKLKPFKIIKHNKLAEISINMKDLDATFLDKFDTISWNLKMMSTVGHSIVGTVFHHTASVIIPPTIFDNYVIPTESSDEKLYYVMQYSSWQGL